MVDKIVDNMHIKNRFYRPQRSCGQGNVFTGVCLSTGGEGVCLSACWDATPQDQAEPPWDQADPPGPGRPPRTKQNPPPGTRQTPPGTRQTPPRDQADPPGTRQTPPPGTRQTSPPGPGRHPPPGSRLQHTVYYERAGTHPTGMHSCWYFCSNLCMAGFPPIRENFEEFFQSGKSGKNRGF